MWKERSGEREKRGKRVGEREKKDCFLPRAWHGAEADQWGPQLCPTLCTLSPDPQRVQPRGPWPVWKGAPAEGPPLTSRLTHDCRGGYSEFLTRLQHSFIGALPPTHCPLPGPLLWACEGLLPRSSSDPGDSSVGPSLPAPLHCHCWAPHVSPCCFLQRGEESGAGPLETGGAPGFLGKLPGMKRRYHLPMGLASRFRRNVCPCGFCTR